MDEHHTECVAEEPDATQLAEVRFGDILELLVTRNKLDDRGTTESHQSGGSCVKPWRARKQINGQTYRKAQNQQLPFGSAKRQQHNENQIDIRMHIPSKTDMVDDQHLKEHEHDETDDL